jgi:eukaryotic-like serine/threonine-protein kinase
VIYQKASSGSGEAELLLPPTTMDIPAQWTRDGRFIVYEHVDPKTKKHDLWVLPVQQPAQPGQVVSPASARPIPFLQTEFDEIMGQLSPDSRWMAYTSNESGQREVHVRPFPPGDGEWKISTAGGDQPRWRGDGKELFYVSASGKMTVVPVKVTPGATPHLEPGVPAPLFETHTVSVGGAVNFLQYDVTADGKRFIVASTGGTTGASPPITAVVNWNAGLKK